MMASLQNQNRNQKPANSISHGPSLARLAAVSCFPTIARITLSDNQRRQNHEPMHLLPVETIPTP
jgi:hypothetical protein